jgi:hypothetical protein
MTWDSLRAVEMSTKCEFRPDLAAAHHFVRLLSGKYTRTLGPPKLLPEQEADGIRCEHVRGRLWRNVQSKRD